MSRSWWSAFALSALLVTIVLVPSSLAADSCQPVFDAITKIVTSPSHSYSTGVLNGKERNTETIYAQGKTYMIVKGKLLLSPVTPNDVLQQEIENEKQGKSSCQFVRNEPVNGEAGPFIPCDAKPKR